MDRRRETARRVPERPIGGSLATSRSWMGRLRSRGTPWVDLSAWGLLRRRSFDAETGVFRLEFRADHAIKAPTEIFIPEVVQYPEGFVVELSDGDYARWNGRPMRRRLDAGPWASLLIRRARRATSASSSSSGAGADDPPAAAGGCFAIVGGLLAHLTRRSRKRLPPVAGC